MKGDNVSVPDVKNSKGEWMKYYSTYDTGVQKGNHTRSAVLWNNLKSRSRQGSAQQNNSLGYTGCSNEFSDYRSFTDWCHGQYGYMHKDSDGSFWSLDKDLIYPGNKVYSPETCMFVPKAANNVVLTSNATRGKYPIGVHYSAQIKRFVTGCRTGWFSGVENNYISTHDTPMEAHKSWQSVKTATILILADDFDDHPVLQDALRRHAMRIAFENCMGIETVREALY